MRRWFALIALAGIMLAVGVGCTDDSGGSNEGTATIEEQKATNTQPPPEPTDTPASSVTYTLDLNASPAGDARIDVIGTTNLPDGALLRVSASRANRWQGEDDIRAASLADNSVTVTNGQFSTSLQLDESDLLVLVGDIDVLDVLSDSVTVCAEFQTGEDFDGQQRQPEPSVVAAVGPFGEGLANSPLVKVFGSATANPSNWLEVETSVGLEPPLVDEITALQARAPTVGTLRGFCL